MKKAVNLRLEERIIVILNNLSNEFHATKTEIIEKAIEKFSKESRQQRNRLMTFAGSLSDKEADRMLDTIQNDKNRKEFSLDL